MLNIKGHIEHFLFWPEVKRMVSDHLATARVDAFAPTGSHEVGGYTADSDFDFVVLIEGTLKFEGFDNVMEFFGYKESRNPQYQNSNFSCYRQEEYKVNLIVYTYRAGYKKFVYATEIAKKARLKDKVERVKLFRAIVGD